MPNGAFGLVKSYSNDCGCIYLLEPILFRIASNPYPSGWNNFARYSSQRSEVFNLTEGEDYLLVGEFKESTGGDYIQVSPAVCLSVCLSVCTSVVFKQTAILLF